MTDGPFLPPPLHLPASVWQVSYMYLAREEWGAICLIKHENKDSPQKAKPKTTNSVKRTTSSAKRNINT